MQAYTVKCSSELVSFQQPPTPKFKFMANNNVDVAGTLIWDVKGMTFEGDADESAKRFFAALEGHFKSILDQARKDAVAEYIKSQQP
jgi:hypothetical protein